jgi:hypothetical protein
LWFPLKFIKKYLKFPLLYIPFMLRWERRVQDIHSESRFHIKGSFSTMLSATRYYITTQRYDANRMTTILVTPYTTIYSLRRLRQMKNFKRLVIAALAVAMVASSSVYALTGESGNPGYEGNGYNATVVITNARLVRPQNRYAPGSARLVYRANGGSIWYYLRNSWYVARDYDGKEYKFYFDSNGITLRASIKQGYKTNVVLKQINGKVYGFDSYGHCLAGLYANAPANYRTDRTGRFFFFNKDGEYNVTTTRIVRNATTAFSSFAAGSKGKTTIDKYAGPVSITRTASRYNGSAIFNAIFSAGGIDVTSNINAVRVYTWVDHFDLITFRIGGGKNVRELIMRVHAPASFYAAL